MMVLEVIIRLTVVVVVLDKKADGEISSDLYHALQCDIEISKVKSFELEKK